METIRDITIGWENGDKYAEINTPNCRIKTRLRKLHEQRPDDFQQYVENIDGSVYAKVPEKWIKVSPPKYVSDEFRESARKHFMKMREDAMA